MAYKYITENNLYHKQTYMYSEYGGLGFLKEYIDSRQEYLGRWEKQSDTVSECEKKAAVLNGTVQDLLNVRQALKAGKPDREVIDLVNGYTKSFEVRKRIYQEYDDHWKPIGSKEFENYEAYLIFAECLALTYMHTECLKYFSCLLKVNDTLLSVQEQLDGRLKKALYNMVKKELDIFYRLAEMNGISLEE